MGSLFILALINKCRYDYRSKAELHCHTEICIMELMINMPTVGKCHRYVTEVSGSGMDFLLGVFTPKIVIKIRV